MNDDYVRISKNSFLKVKGSNVELYVPLNRDQRHARLYFSFHEGLLLPDIRRNNWYNVRYALDEADISYKSLENKVKSMMSDNIYNMMENL